MNREQLIEAAKDRATKISSGFHTPSLEAAIDEGIVDGDTIGLGGGLVAKIEDGTAIMIHNDKETARMALDTMTQEQLDTMLAIKAAFAGRVSYSIG